MNKNAKLSMMARRRRKDGTFMEYMGMNPLYIPVAQRCTIKLK